MVITKFLLQLVNCGSCQCVHQHMSQQITLMQWYNHCLLLTHNGCNFEN